jgi:uncharacterized protein
MATIIQRSIEPSLRSMLPKFPILLVTGPRQSGKTTLLRAAFPDYRYVNLELAQNRTFASEDPQGFLRLYDNKVIIDEAQRVPELFSWLQAKTDESRQMGQYILSGSQNFLLMAKTAQSLAGRVAIFKLLPLSHAELKAHQLLPQAPETALWQGGYPALFDRELTPPQYFPSYIETYLERDVRTLTNVQDLGLFRNFIRLCAGRVGQPINFQSLATDCGINQATVKNWLSILETSHILFQLPPYFENFNKRLIKSPKFYFYDTGLLCHLLDLHNAQTLTQYHNRGSLFENMVIVEMMKNRYNAMLPASFYFWRDNHATEVDLVVSENAQLNLFEIKFSFTIKSDFMKGIRVFRANTPPQYLTGSNNIIYAGDDMQPRTEGTFWSWRSIAEL